MSLDVYLIESNADKIAKWEARKAESLSEVGSMIGLIPLIEEYYNDRKPRRGDVLYENNITHNLGTMADKAGLYEYLWHPERLNIKIAKELIEPLKIGLEKLKQNPDYFKKYNAENGWGKYGSLVSFVKEYLNACIESPDAEVEVLS